MGLRVVVLVLVLVIAGCGRVHFEAVGDASVDSATDAALAFAQRSYVKPSTSGTFDDFGRALAVSADGSTIAVAAANEDSSSTGIDGDQSSNAATDSGAVYIFIRSGPDWIQQAFIKASNTDAGDLFGQSMALSADGSLLAVGAIGEDSVATGIGGNEGDDSLADSGAVYVFLRSGGVWTQQAYLKASNTGAGDNFGFSVALSVDGSLLAVGAHHEDSAALGIGGNEADNAAMDAGAVYVFTRAGATWTQQAYIKASNAGTGDLFGSDVALSDDGTTLAVGASKERSSAIGIGGDQTDNTVIAAGAVYVFTRAGATWTQQAYVKASNTGANDDFGGGLSLSGDGSTLAVAAYLEDSAATTIDGDQLDDSASNAGTVYVFTRSGAAWTQQAYIKASNADAGDYFGIALALTADGSTLAVGAEIEASAAIGIDGDKADNSTAAAGAVYTFERMGGAWSELRYVKASNTEFGDQFGEDTVISADGSTLVVGAFLEDSGSQDQADNSRASAGAAYVFQ